MLHETSPYGMQVARLENLENLKCPPAQCFAVEVSTKDTARKDRHRYAEYQPAANKRYRAYSIHFVVDRSGWN